VTKNKYSVSQYFTVYLNFLYDFSIICSFCSFVEYRAFMKLFHLDLSKLVVLLSIFILPSAVPIVLFFSRLSLSTPLPCTLRVPVQCISSTAPCVLHSVWPIQCHFLSFICCSVGICFVLYHSPSFVILIGYMPLKYS